MKLFLNISLLLLSISALGQVVDDFKSAPFLDFNSRANSVQSSPSILGGRRFFQPSGTAQYIAGVSGNYFQHGANGGGSTSFVLGYGNALSSAGTPLNLSISPSGAIVIETEFAYFLNPARIQISISTDATHVSTSPVIDVSAEGDHVFPIAFFTGNCDLSHVNGITITLVPVAVPMGKIYSISFEEIAIE